MTYGWQNREKSVKRRSGVIGAVFFALTAVVGTGPLLAAAPADSTAREQTTFFRFTAEETTQISGWTASPAATSAAASAESSAATPEKRAEAAPANPSKKRPNTASPITPKPIPLRLAENPSASRITAARPVSVELDASGIAIPERTDAVSSEKSDFALETGAETLEDAWNIALEASRTLQAKDYDYNKATSDVRAAVGVGLPKISNTSGRHSLSEDLAIESTVTLPPAFGGFSLPVETEVCDRDFTTSITALTIPVYMGGRVRGMIEGANAAASAIAAGKQISRLDLKYEVAQTYFLVFRVRKLLEVATEAERTIAAHEKNARRLLENGLVTRNVVLAAQVALADAQQDVLKAQNALSLSEAAYNRLLWRPLDTPVNITDIPIPELSGDLDALTTAALHDRPELTALSHQSRALAAQAKVHRADRLPQVAVVGTHNYIENSHLNTESSFSGTVGMVWMPVDGGVSRARQQASDYEAMSISKKYEDARTGIELQVYQCWLDEQESRGRVTVAQKAVEQSDENLRVVTRGFQEGLVNHTEVLDANTLRTKAWTNLAHARYDAILATYHLRRAVGGL